MSSDIHTSETATMRAITQDRYGSSEVLRLARVPRPVVRDDQVLVRVHAAGLDRGTEHLMTGKPYAVRLAMGLRRPKNPVPGRDVSGTVVETGAGVTRFVPGDEVYGVAPGSFAEYAVAGRGHAGAQAGRPLLRRGRRRARSRQAPRSRPSRTRARSRPASRCWSPVPRAASAATRCSWPSAWAPT